MTNKMKPSKTNKLNIKSEKLKIKAHKQNIESDKLNIESDKLNMESDKLNMESDKLNMESDKLNMESDKLNIKSHKQSNKSQNIPNEFWIFIAVTAGICLALLGSYYEFNKIHEEIFFADNVAFQSVDYKEFIIKTEKYKDFKEDNDQYQYLIKARKGLEQILYHELIQDKPEAHVRNLYMEKQLILQTIKLLWFFFVLMIIHKFIRLLIKSNYKKYKSGINTLLFFIMCFFIKSQIVIPSSWIPTKLIDISGWQRNIGSYINQGKGLEMLSEDILIQPEDMIKLLCAILVIGVILLFIINRKINKGIEG